MKRLIFLIALCAGCANYTQSKIDLVAQAQRGVTQVRQAIEAHSAQATADADALRNRLDAAFDADVASHDPATITGEWIIAHRKAYAAAIDAFDQKRAGSLAADAAALGTLNAIDLALSQLQLMHASELRLTLPEVSR